jgi:hypothetical protein
MNTPFKPLEHSLKRLEEFAQDGDVKMFDIETKLFYQWIPILAGYKTWMGERAVEMARHYQQRYDQVKMMLRKT